MRGDEPSESIARLREYGRVARRLRAPIALLLLLVPLSALAFSLSQQSLYRASAEVLLSYENLATSLSGSSDSSVTQEPKRIAATQARIARAPVVVSRTLAAVGVRGGSAEEFLKVSDVRADPNADVLEFSVEDRHRRAAERLATAYAREYTKFANGLDTAAIKRARQGVARRVRQLEGRRQRRSALYRRLVSDEQQLRAMEALRTANALVVRPAGHAERIQPQPLRNVVVALVVALMLATGVVVVTGGLDTRVRTAEKAADVLGVQLLSRLPEPPRRLARKNRLVMLAEPDGLHAELFRLLKTRFEFEAASRGAQTIMVGSAGIGDGKSTTVANLAIALARAGRRIVLVDFDLRQPILHRFFGLRREPGVTDALLDNYDSAIPLARGVLPELRSDANRTGYNDKGSGEYTVEVEPVVLEGGSTIELMAFTRKEPARSEQPSDPESSADGHSSAEPDEEMHPVAGTLDILPAGRPLADGSEFVGTAALGVLLDKLRTDADFVLFDVPPVLRANEALALTHQVDSVLIVSRSDTSRRTTLDELRRVLDSSPASKLGVVFTGASIDSAYGGDPHYYRGSAAPSYEPVE
jgi:Mrp family chromosome partitioning ATPase/capsular polysaccharide biosynthesis protein